MESKRTNMGTRFSTPSIDIRVFANSIYLESPINGVYQLTASIDFEYSEDGGFTPNTKEALHRAITMAILEGTGKRPVWHTSEALVEYIFLQSEAMKLEGRPSPSNCVSLDVTLGYPIINPHNDA